MMQPPPLPYLPTATIYKSEKFISIETLSGSRMLSLREDEPSTVYLEVEASAEALGRALLDALDRSRPINDDAFYAPDRGERLLEPIQEVGIQEQ